MRLIGLRLENFLAYHQPVELRLDTVDIACLSGSNGAGKSSLLDAVTWALWGKARASDDDALIHSGETQMTVSILFDHDGARYQVIRKHTRSKPNTLSFYRFVNVTGTNGLGGDPEPLGNGLRATQGIIDQLLRLNYETFVNSAFLRQGDADLFTTAKPAERKQVLARILDLDRWERYEKAAKARAREIEDDLKRYQDTIARLKNELTQEPDLQQALATAETDFADAKRDQDAAEHAYHASRGAKAQAEAKAQQMNDLTIHINRDQARLDKLEADYNKQAKALNQTATLIARQAEIEAGWAALNDARSQDSALHQAQLAHTRLSGDLNAARQRLTAEIAAAEREIKPLEKQIATTQKTIEQGDDLAQQLAQLAQIREEQEARQAQLAALQTDSATLTERNKTLKAQMEVLAERRAMLMSETELAICPVCAQPLDDEHRDHLNNDYTREGTALGNEFRANAARLKAIDREMTTIQAALATDAAQLAREKDIAKRHGQIQNQVDQLARWQIDLDQRVAERDLLRNQLATDDYGHEIRAELDAIGYVPAYHTEIRDRMAGLIGYENEYRTLADARARLPDLEQQQAETIREATELQTAIAADQQRVEALKAEIVGLADQMARETQAELAQSTARQIAQKANEKLIRVEQQLKALEDVRRRLDEAEKQCFAQDEEYRSYTILAEACGKNGVPALIIDSAIPEIEQEANMLLGKLTDHRLNIRLDTQKANKSGDVADTLNLQVSDESDTRDYALYSGGEGFRIDFAVRIALSILLARRAGAQLQTLFIDEGFGSQDANGRERLIEAINAIRNRFDLILVVTHIDELRDAFSTHVRVTKEAQGSVIELIQN